MRMKFDDRLAKRVRRRKCIRALKTDVSFQKCKCKTAVKFRGVGFPECILQKPPASNSYDTANRYTVYCLVENIEQMLRKCPLK